MKRIKDETIKPAKIVYEGVVDDKGNILSKKEVYRSPTYRYVVNSTWEMFKATISGIVMAILLLGLICIIMYMIVSL